MTIWTSSRSGSCNGQRCKMLCPHLVSGKPVSISLLISDDLCGFLSSCVVSCEHILGDRPDLVGDERVG